MKKNHIKNLIIYLILTAFFSEQVCFALSISDCLTRQNLAPVLQVNADFFRDYFKKDINNQQIESLTKNSFVALTDQIKQDQDLYTLYNQLNKLGSMNEKETILSLLVMTNGMKAPLIRLFGCTANAFRWKLKTYAIKDEFFKKVNAREIYIKTGLAELRSDDVLYLKMDDLTYGLSKQLMRSLGPKLVVKHKLYENGQLGRFEGEMYKFTDRPNEDVEVTVENGYKTKVKFLSDNTYAAKIARIYDEKGQLIDATRKLGTKLKDLKDNTVILELIKKGAIPVAEATGARLTWGKQYTDEAGRKFDLEGKTVRLTINNGVVVRAVLIEPNIDLPLTIVYESATHLPVYSSVSQIFSERMAIFSDHYVITRLSGQSTLEAGGKTWCTFIDYPNYRVKYFIKQGWVSEVEVYNNENTLVRQKTINLVYDKQGNIVEFLRKMTLEAIVGLNDHTIDYTLYRDALYIANEKEYDIPGSKGYISLGKIIPADAEYPIKGKLIVKNGIITGFKADLAETDNFYYAMDALSQKVLFYFNGMQKDTLDHLDNITIVKTITKATNAGAVKFGGGRVYIKFPQWAVGSWVMFDIHKGEQVRQVKFLNSKDYRDTLKDVNGKPIVYSKDLSSGGWKFSCTDEEFPEEIRTYAQKIKQDRVRNIVRNIFKKTKQEYAQDQEQKQARKQERKHKQTQEQKQVEEQKQAQKEQKRKQEQVEIKQTANSFANKIALLVAENDLKIIASLYVKAANKGFTLSDQTDLINLIDLLCFASNYSLIKDSELSRIKHALLPKISFLKRAKLILNEKEYAIFVKMFGQIKTIYQEYKQNEYGRDEALLKVEVVLKNWRSEFSGESEPLIDEKVFINSLSIRIVRIFFQDLKASYGQVQDKLKEFDLDILNMNGHAFQSSIENLARVKTLNDQLLAMGWEIRFMKNDYRSAKPVAGFISVDSLIAIQNLFKENNIDFLLLRKGLVKDIPKNVSEELEKKFSLEINGFIYQQIIVNIRMLEQSERKIAADIFGLWLRNLKGLNDQLAKSKRDEVAENLNLIFDKGFLANKDRLIENLSKDLSESLQIKINLEQAI